MNEHLRSYLADSLQQIIRMEKRLDVYRAQVVKSRERVIDQNTLYKMMVKNGVGVEDLKHVLQRQEKDQANFEMFTRQTVEDEAYTETFINELIFNTKELARDEMETGGFFTHTVGLFEESVYNESTDNYELSKSNSRIKIMTPTYESEWRDFSKVTFRLQGGKK